MLLSHGLRAASIRGKKLDITNTANTTSTTNTSSYSFASVSLGDAANDRWIVVAISAYSGSVSAIPTSATIGGVSATVLGAVNNSNVVTAIAYAKVTTGATGTIAFTLTSGENAAISVYRVVGSTNISNPAAVSYTTTGTKTAISCGFGSVLVSACRAGSNDTAVSASWTGSSTGASGTLETRPYSSQFGETDSATLAITASATGTSSARAWSVATFAPTP